jgi:hypothetical protein
MIKKIFYIEIPYWKWKWLGVDIYWRLDNLMVTFWLLHKVDIEGYEDERFLGNWKHIKILTKRRKI